MVFIFWEYIFFLSSFFFIRFGWIRLAGNALNLSSTQFLNKSIFAIVYAKGGAMIGKIQPNAGGYEKVFSTNNF